MKRSLLLINLTNFADGIAYFGILTLLTRFLGTELGLSDQVVGTTVSVFTGLVTLLMLQGGGICDKLGVRRAIGLSLVMAALGRCLLATSVKLPVSPLFAGLALTLMAAATGILQPSLYAGIKEYSPRSGAGMGYALLYSIMNLGIAAENMLSPFIRTGEKFFGFKGLDWGINGVYWVMGAVTIALAVVHFAFFTRSVELQERTVDTSLEKASGKSRSPLLDPRFAFFIFILLPVRTLFAHQWLTMPDYMVRCFPKEVGSRFEWIQAINPIVVTIGTPLMTLLLGKVKVLNVMIVGTSLSAVTTFLLSGDAELTRLIVYTVLFSLGEAIWSSRFLEYVAQIAPPGEVGAYMGVANLPWFAAKFTTGLYSGILLAYFIPAQGVQHPGMLWTLYGCLACVSPIGLVLARRWLAAEDIGATKDNSSSGFTKGGTAQ